MDTEEEKHQKRYKRMEEEGEHAEKKQQAMELQDGQAHDGLMKT